MLGEMVDHKFEMEDNAPVQPGQVLGWIEGFKAISDVICVAAGSFAGGNPELKENIALITEANYTEGWLYEVHGLLDDQSLSVQEYADYLKMTIDKILEKQRADEGGLA
jgi:glycine cleavage system H protein